MSTARPTVEEALRQAIALDAPLDVRLGLIRDAYRAHHGPVAAAVDRLVGRLQAAAAGSGAPKPGEPMPAFLLPDETGRLVSLPELLRDGPAVIAFHRGHWCPFCRLNSTALHEVEAEVAGAGGLMVAITPERRGYAAKFKATAGAGFPVLTDMDNGYALALGLAVWIGPEMQAVMQATGRELPDFQGNEAWMLPIPATFVVGRDGRVSERFVDPDYRRRMDTQALLDAVRRVAG